MEKSVKQASWVYYILCAIFVILGFTACNSMDDNIEDPINNDNRQPVSEDGEVLFKNIPIEIEEFCTLHNDATSDEIQSLLEKYGDDVTSEIYDSMLLISLPDGYKIDIDLYGKSLIQPSDWSQYNEKALENFLQDLCARLGLADEDDNEDDNESESVKRNMPKQSDEQLSYSSFHVKTRAASEILINRKVLLWALEDQEVGEVQRGLNDLNSQVKKKFGKGFTLTVKRGKQCTLQSMKTFDQYGIVIVLAHGNASNGGLCYPRDYITEEKLQSLFKQKLLFPKEEKKEDYCFSAELLEELLPERLSNTIIWNCVCYSYREDSEYRKAFLSKDCAVYSGTKGKGRVDMTRGKFEAFAPLFFGGVPVKEALGSSKGFPEFYCEADDDVYIEDHIDIKALAPQNNKPRASLLLPADHLGKAQSGNIEVDARGSHVETELGFHYKNLTTGETWEIPIEESTIEDRKNKDGLTHLLLQGKTDQLPTGKYKYKTYMKANGKTQYSTKEYSFELQKGLCPDDNHPHMIDLGMSVKWACCNIGASKPEEIGQLFSKNDIMSSNDQASVNWGNTWRIPTYDDWDKIIFTRYQKYVSYNGVEGYLISGHQDKKDNKIFLPVTGGRQVAQYWTSTLSALGNPYVWRGSDGSFLWGTDKNHPIRPVCE